MSYIDQNLLTNETILFRTKKHFIIFLAPMIWTIAALLFLLNNNPYLTKVAFLPTIVALGFWLKEGLNYFTSDFAVTNLRVMMREGFFFRHTNEMRLSTIAQVTVNQSLLAQLLGYGTVIINSFGGESDPFSEIAAPVEFQKQVQQKIFNGK